MSDYNEAADNAEKQLKTISPTMCYAKWAQTSIHLTTGMTHSCYHPPLHKIDLEELKNNPSALHNTRQKKNERKKMLAGEKPAGCSYCWKIEEASGRSDRIYRSGEEWAQNSRDDIFDNLHMGNIMPRYVEINFNQACNLKCMYCSPHLSTEWENEIKKHGPLKVLDDNNNNTLHNDVEYMSQSGMMPIKGKQSDNPYLEAFWKWWPDLYRKLEVFRITGGEPLMDVNTFKVLDYIYDNPNTWLELSITTNMSPPKDDLMTKFLDKVKKLEEIKIWEDKERWNPGSGNHWYVNPALKNFSLFVSVDSVDEQAEYIRTGLDYKYMKDNIQKYLTETHNTTLTFINTFNVLSIPKFKDYLEYILDLRKQFSKENQGTKYFPIYDPYNTHPDYEIPPRQRIWFDIPVLRAPKWNAMHILPAEYSFYIQEGIDFMKENSDVDDFVGFYDFEIEKAERNLSIFLNEKQSTDIDLKNFARYIEQHDKRRNTNFESTFPELIEFLKYCKSK